MEHQAFQQWVDQTDGRFPVGFVEDRLKIEARKAELIFQSESHFIGKWANPCTLLTFFLRVSGLSRKGAENALDVRLRNNRLPVARLPEEFSGFRILQISDPHFNDHDQFLENLVITIKNSTFDLCVLTGDYRFRSFGSAERAITGLAEIARVVNTEIIAILGNHDSITMLPEIERLGITVLVNEHIYIKRSNAALLIAGVDDPRYYRTDDIDLALDGATDFETTPSLLLAHSPELYAEATEAGFDAYLCGHTHAGQVCLVPGKTLVKNFRSPSWTLVGRWQHKGMQGYTSAGVGTSVVNARFNCAPEVTLHELCSGN